MMRTTKMLEERRLVGETWCRTVSNASPSFDYRFHHGVLTDLQEPLVKERSIAISVVRSHNRTLPTGCGDKTVGELEHSAEVPHR
jgi:hypothetical protein